jgi:hypothetical protein
VSFHLGGDVVDMAETPEGGPSECVGMTAAAIGLLVSFGSVLAMGLPIGTALFGIGSGLSLIGQLVPAALGISGGRGPAQHRAAPAASLIARPVPRPGPGLGRMSAGRVQ